MTDAPFYFEVSLGAGMWVPRRSFHPPMLKDEIVVGRRYPTVRRIREVPQSWRHLGLAQLQAQFLKWSYA